MLWSNYCRLPQLTREMHFGLGLGSDVCDAADDDTINDDDDELSVTKWQLTWVSLFTIFLNTEENNSFSVTFKLNSAHKNIPWTVAIFMKENFWKRKYWWNQFFLSIENIITFIVKHFMVHFLKGCTGEGKISSFTFEIKHVGTKS